MWFSYTQCANSKILNYKKEQSGEWEKMEKNDDLFKKLSVIQWPCVHERKRWCTDGCMCVCVCVSASHIDSISIFTQPEMDPLKRCSYNTPPPAMNCRSIFQGCIYLQGQASCWSLFCAFECTCVRVNLLLGMRIHVSGGVSLCVCALVKEGTVTVFVYSLLHAGLGLYLWNTSTL